MPSHTIDGIRVTATQEPDGSVLVRRLVDRTANLLSIVRIPAEAIPEFAPLFGVDAEIEHAPDPTLVEVADILGRAYATYADAPDGVQVVTLAERAAEAATKLAEYQLNEAAAAKADKEAGETPAEPSAAEQPTTADAKPEPEADTKPPATTRRKPGPKPKQTT